MSQKPIVLLLIPHLGGGGAEQVTARLAHGLDPARYDLHLALVTQREPGAEPLSAGVQIHCLGASRVRFAAIPLLRLVRRLHPNLILSGMAHLNFLVLLLRPLFPRQTRVLVRQNGSVSRSRPSSTTRALYRFLYPRADAVVCQTPAMASELSALIGHPDKLQVLRNPIPVHSIRILASQSPSLWSGPGPHLLAIGRLAPEKGFDLLLHAVAALQPHFPCLDLAILGDGGELPTLRALAHQLKLSVQFAGHVSTPSRWFPAASAFVLSSRHEGLPNALLEAASAGLPLVATPASAGIVDLLRNQSGAWLAPSASVVDLSQTLRSALQSLCPGQRFLHPWVDAFESGRALAAWQAVLDDTLLARP